MADSQISLSDAEIDGLIDLQAARRTAGEIGRESFLERYDVPGLILSLGALPASDPEGKTPATGATVQGCHQTGGGATRFALIKKRTGSELFPQMVTLGRSESVDLRIEDGTISKLHAFFYKVGGVWVVVDGGSSNGTFVNGLKLVPREPHSLRGGETVNFGYDISTQFMLSEEVIRYLF